jgi:hypothetical protein
MDHRNHIGGVRMGVIFARPSVRRPTRVTNANRTAKRFAFKPRFQRAELAFGAAAAEHAVIEGRDTCGVVAAVFETLERIDKPAGDRFSSQNSDDPAHPFGWPLLPNAYALAAAGQLKEITTHFGV